MDTDKLLSRLPKGPFRPEELRFMTELISTTKKLKGDYLEVGCLSGRSSIVIGLGAKENGARLFCIDIWDSGEWAVIADEIGSRASRYPKRPENISTIFRDNMKKFGLQKTVISIMDRSENVLKGWLEPLRFIHIDGCHEYEFVKKDTEWKKHLVRGGIICFHDYHKVWLGVKRAVDESFLGDRQFERQDIVTSLLAFRRL